MQWNIIAHLLIKQGSEFNCHSAPLDSYSLLAVSDRMKLLAKLWMNGRKENIVKVKYLKFKLSSILPLYVILKQKRYVNIYIDICQAVVT